MSTLHIAEYVHWGALVVMGLVYGMRIKWLLDHKKPPGDRSHRRGDPDAGARYSLMNVAMPWAMESTRKGILFYFSFVIFHIGVAVGIGLAFISTIYPDVLRIEVVAYIVAASCGAAGVIALGRLIRRMVSPVLRLISTPDDYFALIVLTPWFFLGVATQGYIAAQAGIAAFAPLNNINYLIAYLFATSFFLLYVPFSKISHYLYYPFTRWWLGKSLGHRGSLPMIKGSH